MYIDMIPGGIQEAFRRLPGDLLEPLEAQLLHEAGSLQEVFWMPAPEERWGYRVV